MLGRFIRLFRLSKCIKLNRRSKLSILNTSSFYSLADSKPRLANICLGEINSSQRKIHTSTALFITPHLTTMKLDNEAFHALFNDELNVLISVFKKHNYELRIAGGAVRDLLSGVHSDDLDFATTATPDEMLTLFELEGIRTLNRRGEKHGTVTCRINDKENYEVTTLRIDVVTDGRHAEVKFTQDWELDALRRDLTINSMFLGFDGTVYDYFNGMEDLKSKKVKFVGDATSRIQEDYLRILRYFRFYGRISNKDGKHSEETLKSIKDNMKGLDGISGERIWLELKKIFTGRLAGELIPLVVNLGMMKHVGFPEMCDRESFDEIYASCVHLSPSAITLAASLLKTNKDMEVLHKRLKFSNIELNIGLFIIAYRDKVADVDDLQKWTKEYLTCNAYKDPKLQEKLIEFMKYKGSNIEDIDSFREFSPPLFPLNGHQLIEAGVPKGRIMSQVLEELRSRWKDENFELEKPALVELIPGIVESLQNTAGAK